MIKSYSKLTKKNYLKRIKMEVITMFKKLLLTTCALFMLGGMFSTSWADVPAPPVNQNLGIPDGVFTDLKRENCWYCHINDRFIQLDSTPEGALIKEAIIDSGFVFPVPDALKFGVLADRHHARVGRIIQTPTQMPFPPANPQPGVDTYECLNCHRIEWNDTTSRNELILNYRDCTNCHTQIVAPKAAPGDKQLPSASIHHLTKYAQEAACTHCHGSIINAPSYTRYNQDGTVRKVIATGEGHEIPFGRPPTAFTPRC